MSSDVQPGGVVTNKRVLTGNNVEIWAGNVKIGYIQTFSGQNDYGMMDLSGIGDAKPLEYAPGLFRGTIQADRAVVRKASLATLIGSKANATSNPFINMDGALQGKVFDIGIQQKDENGASTKYVRWWRRCSIGADTITVTKNAIIYTNVTLHALDVEEDYTGDGDPSNWITDADSTKGT